MGEVKITKKEAKELIRYLLEAEKYAQAEGYFGLSELWTPAAERCFEKLRKIAGEE